MTGEQTHQKETPGEEASVTEHAFSQELIQAQKADSFCQPLIDFHVKNILSDGKKARMEVLMRQHRYAVDEDGILRRLGIPTSTTVPPAVLPEKLVAEVVESFHDPLYSGHRKFGKMLATMLDSYWFPGMVQYIHDYCLSCDKCQKTQKRRPSVPPMGTTHVGSPNTVIHMDCTKVLGSGNRRGYTHILAIVDAFTGWVSLHPIKTPNERQAAECLFQYISIHSMPITIVTDGGPEFRGKLTKEITKMWGIDHRRIAPWNHQGNGKVEVVHAIIKDMLRAFIAKYEKDWDILLPMLQFAYNTGKNTVTGFTPFHLQFGRPPTMPIDARLGKECPEMMTSEEYVKKTRANMQGIFELVKERREKATTEAAIRFNTDNDLTFFKEGAFS